MTDPKRQFILAYDVGTSSIRAGLFDHTGALVRGTLVKHDRELISIDSENSEIAAQTAIEQIIGVIDAALEKASSVDGTITHCAPSYFWHSIVGVDRSGEAATPVMTWADRRSREQTALLRAAFDEFEVHGRTGARFHSSFWPAKLLWIKENDASAWTRTTRWMSISDLVGLTLFGDAATGVAMASATGMFNIRECVWDTELCEWLGVGTDRMPVLASEKKTFKLCGTFARRWPRLRDTQWRAPVGDGAANNIGSGCFGHGKASLMIGTSGAMRMAFEGEVTGQLPQGLWCYRIDPRRVIVGGALSDGGGLYAMLKRDLRIAGSDDEIAREIVRRGPDSHGISFLPFFAGERSTGYDENASGRTEGVTARHDAVDILQAAMESVIYRFAAILDQMKQICPVTEITASGGAIDNSPIWAQMAADILGRDIAVLCDPEASLRGAVLLALESIGKIDCIDSYSPDTSRRKCDPTRHEIYLSARRRHDEFYDRTKTGTQA